MNVKIYKETLLGMDDCSKLDNEMKAVMSSIYTTEGEIKLRCKLIIDVKQAKFGQK